MNFKNKLLLILYAFVIVSCNLSEKDKAKSSVLYMLSGGITSTEASVTVKTDSISEGKNVRVVLSENDEFKPPYIFSDTKQLADSLQNFRILKFSFKGLKTNTTYYYRAEVDNMIADNKTGVFTTFPKENQPASFKIAFSCGNKDYPETGETLDSINNKSVFDSIRNEKPLFFLHTGDFHYGNLAENNLMQQKNNYESRLQGKQAFLYQNVPLVYIWDDHDFGPNNCGKYSHSKPASHWFYRHTFPHYELAGTDTTPIYQAFTVGRVRFIITDLRTESEPSSSNNPYIANFDSTQWIKTRDSEGNVEVAMPDSPQKSMMGTMQKKWFKNELLKAKDTYGLIVWVSTRPWIGTGKNTDQWWGYSYERREIAKFIHENKINNLCFISGDMHGAAIDNGSHNGYYKDETDGSFFECTDAKGFPVFQAASLTSNPSIKGGPWSHGASPQKYQYGTMEVVDYKDSIKVIWITKAANGIATVNGKPLIYEFVVE